MITCQRHCWYTNLRLKGHVKWFGIFVMLVLWASPSVQAEPDKSVGQLSIRFDAPGHLFSVEARPSAKVQFKPGMTGNFQLRAVATNFEGQQVVSLQRTVFSKHSNTVDWPLLIDALPPGYYQIEVSAEIRSQGVIRKSQVTSSFGIAPLRVITREEIQDRELRFGMKYWQRRWFPQDELMRVCHRLGLVWTRDTTGEIVRSLIDDGFQAVVKIERFPESCFDEERYGPISKWHRAPGVRYKWRQKPGSWSHASVPKREPFVQWVREQVRMTPEYQKVFEIWNEPWSRMPPEDFAKVCNWATEAVLAERPDALVGPNLGGRWPWTEQYLQAGGFKGCNMMALHPYTQKHPEFKFTGGMRQWVRERLAAVGPYVDKLPDVFITEFGWPTPPQGDRAHVTEALQAAYTARVALALYAEDAKALIPHVLGQQERSSEDHEHWYGFFRKDASPKPALLSFAHCARRIDGSNYLGDLGLGENIGAMLFENKGEYTLALWTSDQGRAVELDLGRVPIIKYDLMGVQTVLQPKPGKTRIQLTGNVAYLVGIPDYLREQLVPFDVNRWPVKEFETKVDRARLHWPPRENLQDMRWLERTKILSTNRLEE